MLGAGEAGPHWHFPHPFASPAAPFPSSLMGTERAAAPPFGNGTNLPFSVFPFGLGLRCPPGPLPEEDKHHLPGEADTSGQLEAEGLR